MLTCVATGSPIPVVAWLKDGSPLSGNALDRHGVLYINEFTIQNSGDYTCQATSTLGSAESHLSLTGSGLVSQPFFLWYGQLVIRVYKLPLQAPLPINKHHPGERSKG